MTFYTAHTFFEQRSAIIHFSLPSSAETGFHSQLATFTARFVKWNSPARVEQLDLTTFVIEEKAIVHLLCVWAFLFIRFNKTGGCVRQCSCSCSLNCLCFSWRSYLFFTGLSSSLISSLFNKRYCSNPVGINVAVSTHRHFVSLFCFIPLSQTTSLLA